MADQESHFRIVMERMDKLEERVRYIEELFIDLGFEKFVEKKRLDLPSG